MPPPAISPSRSIAPTVVVSVMLSPRRSVSASHWEADRGAAQTGRVWSQSVHEPSQIVGRALVDDVDVQSQPGRPVDGGGGSAEEDVRDVLVVEDAEQNREIGHDACRAARPARCSSSANR